MKPPRIPKTYPQIDWNPRTFFIVVSTALMPIIVLALITLGFNVIANIIRHFM